MEMIKGVLIAFDTILMMMLFGIAVYSKTKEKETGIAIMFLIVGAVIALNEAFVFLA